MLLHGEGSIKQHIMLTQHNKHETICPHKSRRGSYKKPKIQSGNVN